MNMYDNGFNSISNFFFGLKNLIRYLTHTNS